MYKTQVDRQFSITLITFSITNKSYGTYTGTYNANLSLTTTCCATFVHVDGRPPPPPPPPPHPLPTGNSPHPRSIEGRRVPKRWNNISAHWLYQSGYKVQSTKYTFRLHNLYAHSRHTHLYNYIHTYITHLQHVMSSETITEWPRYKYSRRYQTVVGWWKCPFVTSQIRTVTSPSP